MRWLMGWSAWQFISFMISKKKVTFPESGIVLGTICIHTAGRRERLQRPQTANLKLLREGGFARAPRNRKPCQVDADCGACRTIYYREHHSLSKCTTYWGGEENVKRGRNPIIFLIFFALEPRLRFSPQKKRSKFCKKIKMHSKHCAQMHATRSTRLKYGQIITLFRAQYWTINQNGGSLRLGASVLSDHEPKN